MTELRDFSTEVVAGQRRPPFDLHSRLVFMAKRLLPLAALGLAALVVVWPRLDVKMRHLDPFARVDPRLAHDLRMVNARYTGVDRDNRPFVITAAAVEQLSNDLNDLVGLDDPKADLDTNEGGWLEVSAYTGTYQPNTKVLYLFGNVSLFADRGDEFHSDIVRVDLANNTAESTEPVKGQGPFGHVTAQGFRLLDRGATIMFTGHTDLELDPATQKATP